MNNGNGDDGIQMSREAHVRFCESVGVKLPPLIKKPPLKAAFLLAEQV